MKEGEGFGPVGGKRENFKAKRGGSSLGEKQGDLGRAGVAKQGREMQARGEENGSGAHRVLSGTPQLGVSSLRLSCPAARPYIAQLVAQPVAVCQGKRGETRSEHGEAQPPHPLPTSPGAPRGPDFASGSLE